jgi:hypothetical protein
MKNTGRQDRGIDLGMPMAPPIATVIRLPYTAEVERVDVLGD